VIAGHFGFAAAVKSRERQVSLWALMLATVWLDIVFVPLFLSGIETIVPVPQTHGGYGNLVIHADYTHSLVGALALSVLFGTAFSRRWGWRSAWVLAFVSFSHWLLDLIVHRADMPILPGNIGGLPKLGFGLWRMQSVVIGMEFALVLAGAWFYWRAARSVTVAAGRQEWRAALAGTLVLVLGLLVLALDVTGILD